MANNKIFCGLLLLGGVNLLFFLYLMYFFRSYGYLPAPFISDKSNTFMDFYNVLYWSGQDGIYTLWSSVYPPINFLILQSYRALFMPDSILLDDGFAIREFYGSEILVVLSFYALCIAFTIRVTLKHLVEFRVQCIMYLVIVCSTLFLFSVERANLIILCLPVLGAYVSVKNKIHRALLFSVLVNLKPYLAILYIIELLNVKSNSKNIDYLVLAPIFSIVLFIITGIVLNQEYYIMPLNLVGFGLATSVVSPIEVLAYPSSIASFSKFKDLLPNLSLPRIMFFIPTLGVLIYIGRCLLIVRKNYINNDYLIILSVILLTNLPIHVGGYATLLYVPIIGLLYRNKEHVLLILITTSFFCNLWDFFEPIKLGSQEAIPYLSGKKLIFESTLTLGSIVRPTVNFAVLVLFFYKIREMNNEKINQNIL